MMNTTKVKTGRHILMFLAGQAVAIVLLLSVFAYAWRETAKPWKPPALREVPLRLDTYYDYEDIVSNEQLQRVLLRLRPRLEGTRTLVANIDHGYRLWGSNAEFGDPQFVSGAELLNLLVDHRRFAELYGPHQPPLLIDRERGVAYRVQEGHATCSHTDHTVACIAELGIPLSQPIITPTRETTYREVVEQSLRDFDIGQLEYEWSAKIFALFLPPTKHWVTSDGSNISFDRLADHIMRDPFPRGVCWANHRIFGLAAMLRIDEQTQIFSPPVRERIFGFLEDATRRLVENQHADGFWNDKWYLEKPATAEPTERDGDMLGDRILVTGHVMEWWALAPERVHPPREVLISAGQWLVRTIDEMSEDEIQRNFAFLSHAGRALAACRNCEPFEVLQAMDN